MLLLPILAVKVKLKYAVVVTTVDENTSPMSGILLLFVSMNQVCIALSTLL